MTPSRPRHGHALVIGAGISGLAAARVLSEAFDQVTIVERDRLSDGLRPRPGVPQGRHGHALAARGLHALESLFPGVSGQLHAAGAPTVDFCLQAKHHWPGTPQPISSQVTIQPASRPLLETVLRHRVIATPGVRLLDGCTVTGLRTGPDGACGVHVARHDGAHGPSARRTASAVDAQLIVDASGRSSHLPDWLESMGLPRPRTETVDAHVGYATRSYHADPDLAPGWRALFDIPRAPDRTRGCFALHVEDGRLLISLQGVAGDHPPTDEDGFNRFMKSLDCGIASYAASLRPASGVYRYGRSAGHRRRYHRLRPWPDGLIVLGDAACTFNPLYAQGMTVAALEALALGDLLTRTADGGLHGLPAAFQRRVARITAWPWAMSTLGDRAWTETSPLVKAAHWYLASCQDLAVDDPRAFHDLARVTNMLAGPAVLAHPHHLRRVLRARLWPAADSV
jgi:2-polyprenyl-6-methoxyphenol hydroxylase-like FAD-dependent oxidoreductase